MLAESLLATPTGGATLQNPRDDPATTQTYKAFWTSTLPPDDTAGVAHLFGEPGATNNMEQVVGFEWYNFKTPASLTDKLISAHSGGINVSFCDGHQYYMSSSMDLDTFKLLMTPWGEGIPRDSTGMATPSMAPWKNSTNTSATITGIPITGTILDEGNL